MKKRIKNIVNKIIYRHKADSKSYVQYLRNLGVRIGENTIIYTPRNITIDVTRPWLIEIGDNVKITKGVTIGENVIIGANSLVNKDIPSNVVVAGNPARVIMSLEEYYKKRKDAYIDEAREMTIEYIKVYNKKPDISIFHEFFPLFMSRESNPEKFEGISFVFDDDLGHDIRDYFYKTTPIFESFEHMINYFTGE